MKYILSVENMRKSDAHTIETKVSGKELMKRAGRAVFEAVPRKAPVAIVCGTGNNAGDGYVIAGLLMDNNIPCRLFLTAEKFSDDGKYYFDEALSKGVRWELLKEDTSLCEFSVIIDCVLGTGFNGVARGAAALAIDKINEAAIGKNKNEKTPFVVSVDINSGLSGNSGTAVKCVRSDLTVSVGGFKPGHFLNMAKDVMARKINADIGIDPLDPPFKLIEAEDLKSVFRERKNFSNKGSYGYVALIGGSLCYSGAAKLANISANNTAAFLAGISDCAMRAGAGVVKLAVPQNIAEAVTPFLLESTLFPLKCDKQGLAFDEEQIRSLVKNTKACAIGMGIGKIEAAAEVLEYLLSCYKGVLIIDADGLNLLSENRTHLLKKNGQRVILTPHLKEFSRLCGKSMEEINAAPIESAVDFSREHGCVTLLKGPSSIVTDGKDVYITDTGCPGMATAGSGDVLSGIMAAVCGYNTENPLLAAAAAAFVNGRAGELAQARNGAISMTAKDTADFVKDAVLEITH